MSEREADEEECYMAPAAEQVLACGDNMSKFDEALGDASGEMLSERFVSKEWKVRQQAYDESTLKLKEENP